MLRLALVAALLAAGCGDDDCCTGSALVDAPRDTPLADTPDPDDVCPGPGREKIKFPRAYSCGNDGAVEWCIPDNDAQLMTTLAAISPTIACAAGGGRAGCYDPPGLLLCSYPTTYPAECLTQYGEMKPEVWADICDVAAQPQITEIVPMVLE